MAVVRDDPYGQFNFLVDLGTGAEGTQAGFAECSGLSTEVTVIEYRNGNDKTNAVRKLPGLSKAGDVTLKRGIIGALDLYQWLNEVRDGNVGAVRTVLIQLQNEDRSAVVLCWKLSRARIIKHTSGPLNAKGTDVAIEEIVLAHERLELE
ncbi:MAG: phage tail protein [Actinomycetota bacterium]